MMQLNYVGTYLQPQEKHLWKHIKQSATFLAHDDVIQWNIFRVTGHLCGISPVTGEFPTQRLVTRSFNVFFDLRLN